MITSDIFKPSQRHEWFKVDYTLHDNKQSKLTNYDEFKLRIFLEKCYSAQVKTTLEPIEAHYEIEQKRSKK